MNLHVIRTLVIALAAAATGAASQLGSCFDQARAGKSFDECAHAIDWSKVDLSEETPHLLLALNGRDGSLARRAAGVALAVLIMRPDAKTKLAARALVPAISVHYDDPDPDQPPGYNGPPTDAWRRTVMYIVVNSDAEPAPPLLAKIEADLNRKGDAQGKTANLAAGVLLHLRPIPPGVIEAVLSKMDEPGESKADLIEIFGNDRVDDPRVVSRIVSALEVQPAQSTESTSEQISASNVVQRVAAEALGRIGPAASSALPALSRLAASTDATVDRTTRDAARQAIALIETRR